ncbi:hypothetical protein SAMN04488026_101757 [Aliiruegeria lutimaris]|uniref:Uncharacterized protein n=1 Tax=Aliiruegeria lutimaris TaxID=571298 RepID=A0A1G8TNV3_9RHOB|nr:hypothetical protein SAMN04488026_101757 [Aliiruegeria lutimaris]
MATLHVRTILRIVPPAEVFEERLNDYRFYHLSQNILGGALARARGAKPPDALCSSL